MAIVATDKALNFIFGITMLLQRSLTLRLTCLSAISTIMIIAGLSWLINNAMENYFTKEDLFTLKNRIEMIKDVISKSKFADDFTEILGKLESHEGLAIKIDHPDNHIAFYVTDNIRFPDSLLDGNAPHYSDFYNKKRKDKKTGLELIIRHQPNNLLEWEDKGNQYRGIQSHFTLQNANHSSVVITLALNINHHTRFLNALGDVLVKFTLIASFISMLLHGVITYHGLKPLKILARKAKLVSGKEIKQRMPTDNLPVEIAGLSETLNNMLDRLEDSFQRLEHFSSDIAHELRTPINNLMMQTQVVLSQPRSKHEYFIALGSNIEEFERMARMIADMLFLAKADNEQLLLSDDSIFLEDEVAELFEFYDALAEDCCVQLSMQGRAEVKGDKLMLRRALSNLISNAMHHGFSGSEINIDISSWGGRALLKVTNHGDTIPADILPHLFTRFYRADKARTSGTHERVGLGLAITESIAKAHGGGISVTSKDNMTVFTFIMNTGLNELPVLN